MLQLLLFRASFSSSPMLGHSAAATTGFQELRLSSQGPPSQRCPPGVPALILSLPLSLLARASQAVAGVESQTLGMHKGAGLCEQMGL